MCWCWLVLVGSSELITVGVHCNTPTSVKSHSQYTYMRDLLTFVNGVSWGLYKMNFSPCLVEWQTNTSESRV
jgi:hypothetical protein